jgi:Mrp family chromosome partitioning ATPase
VIVAGTASRESVHLIHEKRLHQLLARAEEQYDLLVVDTAAASISDDFIPFAKVVSAVVLIGGLGVARHDGIRSLAEQLDQIGIEPIGVVVNWVPTDTDAQRRPEPAREFVAAE